MVSFIDDDRHAHGAEPTCAVLPIAPPTYYEIRSRRAAPGRLPPCARRDAALKDDIRRMWKDNFAVYGARKAWRQMNRGGVTAARAMAPS